MLSSRKVIIALVALVALVVLYYEVNPSQTAWMPQCYFKELTGWSCLTCGSQRAFHHLLHGRVLEGIRYNYFLLVLVPWVMLLLAERFFGPEKGWAIRLRKGLEHPVAWTLLVLLCVAWIVLRNLLNL